MKCQDGSTDANNDNEGEGDSADGAEAEDKLSDVSSSNEADEELPNQCLSQFTKVCHSERMQSLSNGPDRCQHVAWHKIQELLSNFLCAKIWIQALQASQYFVADQIGRIICLAHKDA